MFRLAAVLDMPVAINVVAFSTDAQNALVECEMEAGVRQILELPLPCVIGAGKDLNKPRYPTFIDIRKAKKKEIQQIHLASLQLEKPSAGMEILELKSAVEQRQAKELKGQPEEVVKQLIQVLHDEAKVL
jgi:electron transfer flavoprotein beta subunit